MKDMSINQKKVGGRNFEEEFGQALFFVSPTPHYVPRETEIEPDRRLTSLRLSLYVALSSNLIQTNLYAITFVLPSTLIVQWFYASKLIMYENNLHFIRRDTGATEKVMTL